MKKSSGIIKEYVKESQRVQFKNAYSLKPKEKSYFSSHGIFKASNLRAKDQEWG